MKYIISLIVFSLISTIVLSSVLVTGTVENSKSDFVNLVYTGASVTLPNYYGANNISAEIKDNKFEFVLEADKDYSLFTLSFLKDKESFGLFIKDKDTVDIKVDMKNINKTFEAKGNNSAMTNYLFAKSLIPPKSIPDLKPNEIIPFWKNNQRDEIELLQSFKSNTLKRPQEFKCNEEISRLINISSLSQCEFDFLLNRTSYYIVAAINHSPFEYLVKHLDDYLELYSAIDLSNHFILNDWMTDDLTAMFIEISGYQEAITKNNSYNRVDLSKYVYKNYFNLSQKVLTGKLLEKTICDKLYDFLLDGKYEKYEKIYTESLHLISTENYKSKLETFYSGYLNAFNYSKFGLNLPEKMLNDSTIVKLMDSFKGEKIYLTLWHVDASYNLTPMWNISTIEKIQNKFSDDVRFVNINIGNINQKKHWASLIVNHNWKGEHYFYLDNGNSKFRTHYNFIDELKSCNGELYYLLSESGEILINKTMNVIMNIE